MSWKKTADAVVIGGGMMGVSTAYYLKMLGMKEVALVEKGSIASGSTGRCAASFRAQWGAELNIVLGKACVEKFESLSALLGRDIGLHQNGYLLVAYTEKQFEQYKKNVTLQNSLGVESCIVDHKEAQKLCPGINVDDAVGFAFHSRDGHADPMVTCLSFKDLAVREGVRVEKFTEVIGFKTDGGRVTGVRTNRGEINTPIVINAAGPWAGRVGALAGLNIPIRGERHEIFATEPVEMGVCPIMVMSFDPEYYMFQRPHGSILAGCGPHHYRAQTAPFDEYEMGSSWNFLEYMTGLVSKIIPRSRGLRIVRQWAGMYDMTPDMQPVIGEADELPGFWVQSSGSRGFMFGAVAGEMLAEKIITGKATLPIEAFHWRRYAEGKPLIEPSVA